MSPVKFKVGDLVWAKLKGFCPWPGRVSNPPPEMKTPKNLGKAYIVYFFGTNNYGFVKENNIKLYLEHKARMVNSSKTMQFKYALQQIEEYVKCPNDYCDKFGLDKSAAVTEQDHKKSENLISIDCKVEVEVERDSFQCNTCSETFADYNILLVHNETHVHNAKLPTNESEVTNLHDPETDSQKSKSNEEDQQFQQTEDNKYMCKICNKIFNWESHIWTHLRSHTSERPYSCHLCHRKFFQGGALNLHLRRHAGIKDYICTYCDKQFLDKSTLTRHYQIHTGMRPYNCAHCSKTFNDPTALKCHTSIHTDEQPYKCSSCRKSFNESSALVQHTKQHQGQEYVCMICDNMFYTRIEMKNHVLSVHNAQKKFQCNDCDKRFALKYLLANHIKLKHPCHVIGEN